jgi:hypothetical protein
MNRGPKDLETLLQELDAVLKELHTRGQQLQLIPDESARQPPRGIDHPLGPGTLGV